MLLLIAPVNLEYRGLSLHLMVRNRGHPLEAVAAKRLEKREIQCVSSFQGAIMHVFELGSLPEGVWNG